MEGPSLPKTFLVLVVVVGAKPAGSSGSDGIVLGVSNSDLGWLACGLFVLLASLVAIAVLCLRLARKWDLRRGYLRQSACYICAKEVCAKWGQHRAKCRQKNAHKFAHFYQHPFASCPICKQPLLLLPCSPFDFMCQNELCRVSGPHRQLQMNCGDNRYNCFLCDYDLCRDCIERL